MTDHLTGLTLGDVTVKKSQQCNQSQVKLQETSFSLLEHGVLSVSEISKKYLSNKKGGLKNINSIYWVNLLHHDDHHDKFLSLQTETKYANDGL